MFNQNTDKTLNAAKDHTVNHDGPVFFTVGTNVIDIKTLRHLEIKLNGTALPGPANAVFQVEINFGAVEGAVTFVYFIRAVPGVVKCLPQGIGCQVPFFLCSHGIFRTSGQVLHGI
jgi:hypothetical protein